MMQVSDDPQVEIDVGLTQASTVSALATSRELSSATQAYCVEPFRVTEVSTSPTAACAACGAAMKEKVARVRAKQSPIRKKRDIAPILFEASPKVYRG